jgi:hypothetical protein
VSFGKVRDSFTMGLADRDYMKKGYQVERSAPKRRGVIDLTRTTEGNKKPRRLRSRLNQKYYDLKRWFFNRRHPYSRFRLGDFTLNTGLTIGLILALFIVLSYFEVLNSFGFWFTWLGIVLLLALLYFIAKYFYNVLINLKYGIRGLSNGAKLILVIFLILGLWQVYQGHPDLNTPESVIDTTNPFNINPIQDVVSNFTKNITDRAFSSFDPSSTFNASPKSQSYYYCLDGRKSITFTTYGGLSNYLAKEDHSYYSDYKQEVIMELFQNSYQDEYLEPFIDEIRGLSNSPDNQAKIAISLVQHIPYKWSGLYITSTDWYYPYETLYQNQGVCCDKSVLLAYLLDQLGYDVVLFEWDQHMAVGIRCSEKYDFQNTGYAFIETTRPTIITYVPDEYLGGFQITPSPNIIQVSEGGRILDLSEEYKDAQEYENLVAMGTVLDQYRYSRWVEISNKYDLQYDT